VNINATLLGQMITFAVLVYVVMKYVWPPIMQAMDERTKKITDGLAAAEAGKRAQEEAQQLAQDEVAKARSEAQEIIARAERRANEIVDEAKDDARTEGERITAQAQSEIDQEVNRAREQLRGQVSQLAVAGAQQILGREVDGGSHSKLLDELAAKL